MPGLFVPQLVAHFPERNCQPENPIPFAMRAGFGLHWL